MPATKVFFTVKWAPGLESLETALLGSTSLLPSTLCDLAFLAALASSTVRYVTNPKNLECLVFSFLLTTGSVSVSGCSPWFLRLSTVASNLKPPLKSFCSCSGFLGNSDLDLTTAGGQTSTMLTWRHPPAERSDLIKVPQGWGMLASCCLFSSPARCLCSPAWYHLVLELGSWLWREDVFQKLVSWADPPAPGGLSDVAMWQLSLGNQAFLLLLFQAAVYYLMGDSVSFLSWELWLLVKLSPCKIANPCYLI